MHRSLRLKIIALAIAHALLASSLVPAQDASQTRPRRTQSQTPSGDSGQRTEIRPARGATNEPLIRIGLSTDARSATISTTGKLLSKTEPTALLSPLSVARVRVEARLLAPRPETPEAGSFQVELARYAARPDAERTAREVRETTGAEVFVTADAPTNTWRIRVGSNLSASRAAELRAQLEDAGFATAIIVEASGGLQSGTSARANDSSLLRTVSRTGAPTREVVAYASGSSRLFNTPSPVTFAAEDERSAPLRFNEKPYRGQLEVFANPRGTLTIVNVLSLEDYVRGVVPNELSPGGYPAIEAQKAQAVAARTYAVRNRNQFAAQGFDLLPTTRSQVYGGLSTEHPLSTQAVEETRGLVATYRDEPINALYTSTCGGRTEDVENIFNEATPYLRGRECSLEAKAHLSSFTVRTSRDLPDITEEANAGLARDAALLEIHGFNTGSSRRLTDAWLNAPVSSAEIGNWLMAAARQARQQSAPQVSEDATRPPGFSTALVTAIFGESRADTLLDNADVEYLLAFRDAADIPARNRADVAWLVRDGFLSLFPDATLRPRAPLSRGRAIQAIARLLDSRASFGMQKGVTRPTSAGALVIRSNKNRDLPITVSADAHLFRTFGSLAYPMRSVALVGGEQVTFHVNSRGEVDFLEVRPAPSGAAADRSSPFAHWTMVMSVGEVQSRLARWSRGTGALTDLRVASRGSSRRATDLVIVGANGTAHVRGGRIRSALGLREQLFVIDRNYDDAGRLTGFTFTGRGWGHGVGLCQVGAYGLARQGLTYDRILKTYYTGIELTRLYN